MIMNDYVKVIIYNFDESNCTQKIKILHRLISHFQLSTKESCKIVISYLKGGFFIWSCTLKSVIIYYLDNGSCKVKDFVAFILQMFLMTKRKNAGRPE